MMNCTDIDRWRSPASAYARRKLGRAEIVTSWYWPGYYFCYMQRGFYMFRATRRLYVTALKVAGRVVMVDDPPHWWAMEDHASQYSGHVVCAGLGLGLMIHALDAREEVTRITVVEREADVIELLTPLVPSDKLHIVQSDWFDFDPRSVPEANGVLFDLFVGDAREMIGEAIRVAAEARLRWEASEDFVVRVHGFTPDLIDAGSRAIVYG